MRYRPTTLRTVIEPRFTAAACLVAIGAGACGPPAECWAEVEASGAYSLSWDASTDVDCEGFGPRIDGSIDLYWTRGFDSLRVRVDFVEAGSVGAFTDTFLAIEHNDDQWGAFDDVACSVNLDRDEKLGGRYAVEGSATCDADLTGSLTDGTVTISQIRFANSY